MEGKIDASFQTVQRDLFTSGIAAEIGMNAFGVWLAIKSHADYNTGKAWPGMRRLAEMTGQSLGLVHKAVQVLIAAHLLRVDSPSKGARRGQTYIACERLDIRLGSRILCTVVLDYVPATLRHTINGIDQALKTGEANAETFAQCMILPGEGLAYNAATNTFVGLIPSAEIPTSPPPPSLSIDAANLPLVQKVLNIQSRIKKEKAG